MSRAVGTPRAAIFGCAGPQLSEAERRFFAETNPLGFILFTRNVETPDQVRSLIAELRDAVGDNATPVLIDQEGGRVQRLGPPHWPDRPKAAEFAAMATTDMDAAVIALTENTAEIARDLRDLGITVDCWPVLDLPQLDADPIIGDRAFGVDTAIIARLGRVVCETLQHEGVTPVIKHIPGHGRATVDSHKSLPQVDTDTETLRATDFEPFTLLNDAAWAMTAHVVYTDIDPDACATFSPTVINEVVRDELGFDGLLITDDLSMGALSGGFAERTQRGLRAGCDLVLHCNGDMQEMTAIAEVLPTMTDAAVKRYERAEVARLNGSGSADD